jgi:hypothetical protein
MIEKPKYTNRVSINLEKYLNPLIDEMEFDIEFNYLPKWFKLPKIFKRKEKGLEDKI